MTGNVLAGDMQFSIVDQYGNAAVSTVQGPTCTLVSDLVCNANGPYTATYTNNFLVVSVNSQGSHNAVSAQWSTDESNVTFSDPSSSNPSVIVSKIICDGSFEIELAVADANLNMAMCSATVTVADTEAPVLLGLESIELDLTANCHDIPAAFQVSARDDSTPSVVVEFDEATETDSHDSDPAGFLYRLSRTWSATDACENSNLVIQTITVVDQTPPTFPVALQDLNASCDAIPADCDPIVNDECDDNVTVVMTEEISDIDCTGTNTMTRTYTATDASGNTAVASHKIYVKDTTAPKIISPVQEISTADCNLVPSMVTPTVSDNCDHSPSLVSTEVRTNDTCTHQYTLVRTHVANDDCGNQAVLVNEVSVVDTEAPTLHGQTADKIISCDQPVEPCEVTASDNCDPEVTVVMTSAVQGGLCNQTYDEVFTFTATDDCGNSEDTSQTIHVVDNTPPTFSGVPPTELTATCEAIPTFDLTATDDCGAVDILYTEEMQTQNSSSAYVMLRTWSASDECGNVASVSQLLTVYDDAVPTILGAASGSFAASCEHIPDVPTVTVTDNCVCDDMPDVVYTETKFDVECLHTYKILRHWYAEDCAGNSAELSQTIVVTDEENPTLSDYPADESNGINNVSDPAYVTADDNCDFTVEALLTTDVIKGNCTSSYTLLRTWTATDDCGNTVSHTQTVEVTDSTPPVLPEIESEIFASCDDVPEGPDTFTVTDNTGAEVEVSYTDEILYGDCPHWYTIIRTYNATDECGNAAAFEQYIEVQDLDAPVMTELPDDGHFISIEYGVEPPAAPGSVTDNCDENVDITFSELREDDSDYCDTEYTLTRTWTASDQCGNQAPSVTEIVEVRDTTPPTWVDLPETVIEISCNETVPEAPTLVASDVDDIANSSYTEEIVDQACDHTYIIERVWIVQDCIGNKNTFVQNIYVSDVEAPIISGASSDNITVNCSDLPDHLVTSVVDNCDETVEVVFSEDPVDIVHTDQEYTLHHQWASSDDCGNRAHEERYILVVDEIPPTLVNTPPTVTLEACNATISAVEVSAFDNCDDTPTTAAVETRTNGSCEDSYFLTRSFSATDDSGNTATHDQVIIVLDRTPPTFDNVPDHIEVSCDDIPAIPNITATDWCDSCVQVTVVEQTLPPAPGAPRNDYQIIRTWTATDNCDNQAEITQVINVTDSSAPTIGNSLASSIGYKCEDDVPLYPVWPEDTCPGNFTVTYDDAVAGLCPTRVIRTWTVTDEGGNANTETQTFFAIDFTPPVIHDTIENMTVYNETDIPGPPLDANVTDNCHDVEVTCSTDTYDELCHRYVNYFCTWVDECGNHVSITQQITWVKTVQPMLIGVPEEDLDLDCSAIIYYQAPEVTNEKGETVEPVLTPLSVDCDHTYSFHLYWMTTHECGASDSADQILTFTDNTPPTISAGDYTEIDCSEADDYIWVDPSVDDDCDPHPALQEHETVDGDISKHNYVVTRTYTATDECGNTATSTATLTVSDNEPPVLQGVPNNTISECPHVPVVIPVTASDNCGNATVTMTETREDGDCPCNYTLIRRYRAVDNSGLEDFQTQYVVVQDTTPPVLNPQPGNLYNISDGSVPEAPTVTATDNSGDEISVVFTENYLDNSTLIRQWCAIDLCGNSACHDQLIEIVDTTPPNILCAPEDVVVECDDLPDVTVWTLTMEDCADADVTIELTDVFKESGDCLNEYTVTYTWTATDGAGNTDTTSTMVTVVDTTDPYWLDSISSGGVFECEYDPPALPAAEDICGNPGPVSVTVSESIVHTAGNHEHEYTDHFFWTATDVCGHEISADAVYEVIDSEDPLWVTDPLPGHLTVECDAIPLPAEVEAWDECYENITVEVTSNTIGHVCNDEFPLIYTFTATDKAGHFITHDQHIVVSDTSPPQFDLTNFDPVISASCGQVPDFIKPNATDNCDDNPLVFKSEIKIGKSLTAYDLVRTFLAVDACGNSNQWTQIVNVTDSTAPVIYGVPGDTTVECGSIPPPADPSVGDNCDVNVTLSYLETRVSADCPLVEIITRTWTAQDESGNTHVETQTISVKDTTAPTIFGTPINANVSYECGDDVPDYIPTGEDICDGTVHVTMTESFGTSNNTRETIRTWTAVDACGNEVVVTMTISVADTTPPFFIDTPDTEYIFCDQDVNFPEPVAADICDKELSVVFEDTIHTQNCAQNYAIERVYTVTDDAGLSATVSKWIWVVDETPPFFTYLPVNDYLYLQCNDDVDNETVTIDDNCDENALLSYYEQYENSGNTTNATATTTIYRTWYAVDECGNDNQYDQVVEIVDTDAPEMEPLSYPGTAACDDIPELVMPTATDNCDSDVRIEVDEHMHYEHCPYVFMLVRTYTATDTAGNVHSETYEISIEDNEAPVITGVPASGEYACDAVPEPADIEAEDNCDPTLHESYSVTKTGNNTGEYSLLREWRVCDDCGNCAYASQALSITDDEAPYSDSVPGTRYFDCAHHVPTPSTLDVQDNCDVNVTATVNDTVIPGDCTHEWTIIRTWTAVDGAGNSNSWSTDLHFSDDNHPFWVSDFPEDGTTVECLEIEEPADMEAEDTCDDNVEITVVSYVTGNDTGSSFTYDLTRTWTAVDDCGNEATHSTTTHVVDTTDPEIHLEDSWVEVACEDVPDKPDPIIDDNCDSNLDVEYTYHLEEGDCEFDYTITHTWEAEDHDGNKAKGVMTILVSDTEPPVFSEYPAPVITVSCDAVPEVPVINATDNCDDGITVNYKEEKFTPEGHVYYYQVLRTWTAEDSCGNQEEYSQLITVMDQVAPVISPPQPNVSVEVPAIPNAYAGLINVTDNCAEDPTLIFNETITNGSCEYQYTLVRTWTAEDYDGNVATMTFYVEVHDTTPPVIHGVPDDYTIEGHLYALQPTIDDVVAMITITDNSGDESLVITATEVVTDQVSCHQYVVIRTFTVTDDCGNMATVDQTITVIDTHPPMFNQYPENITVQCTAVPTPCTMTIFTVDDCDRNITVDHSESRDGDLITHTWTAMDDAGNTAVHVQTISIVDTDEPMFTTTPGDTHVECTCDNIPVPTVYAFDNCDAPASLSVVFDESVFVDNDESASYVRTVLRSWSVSDSAGNEALHSQIITIDDTTPPMFDEYPGPIVESCDSVSHAPVLTAIDLCTETRLNVTMTEESDALSCPQSYQLTRTWSTVDPNGNTATHAQVVSVEDMDAPSVHEGDALCVYPPRAGFFGAFENVVSELLPASLQIHDACDEAPTVTVVSCSSTQPSDAVGGESGFSDQCTYDADNDVLYVQAEVSDDSTRDYMLMVSIADACGNSITSKQVFRVPATSDESVGLVCLVPEVAANEVPLA